MQGLHIPYVSIKPPHFKRRRICGLLCFLFLVAVHFSIAAAHAAQPTLAQQMARLEEESGMVVDQHSTLPQRLSVVELKVFGRPSSGPLLARIEALRHALDAKRQEQMAPSYATNVSPITDSLGDTMPLLNAVPPNFLRIEAPGAPADTSDYWDDVLKGNSGKILRFKTMPVPVFINQYPDRQFTAAVVKGFETWEERTQGTVRFVQVDEASKARIIVVWKRLGKAEDQSGCTLGAHTITKYTSKGKGSVSVVDVGGVPVPIYIPKLGPKYTVPPQVIEVNLDLMMSKSPMIRYRLLQNVVAHELGHALGLLGHSQNTYDLMFSVTDEHSRLSERDVNTLNHLYKTKVDVPL